MIAKKLDKKVKEGQFNQISNIPMTISRLKNEADSLNQELAKVGKRDYNLEA